MPDKTPEALVLILKTGAVARLTTILQRGFLVPCTGQTSLQELLLSLPGFDRQYISTNIETIFINGTASDSFEQLLVPGNTVALSAAMPGLAGAIFRKGGTHASLRSKPVLMHSAPIATHGFITVKLFNMVAGDKGVNLLAAGIIMKGSVLARFFNRQQERLQPLLVDIRYNSTSISLKDAQLLAAAHSRVRLRIESL